MQIETILDDKENSFLVITVGEITDIAIAVPHHAPLGVTKLPNKEHPEADENAGVLGYYLSRLLNCPSIIACNYFIDSNKYKDSDYCEKILSLKPKILVEIHGHGGHSAKFDIEISSGSLERNFWSQEIAERLREKLTTVSELRGYTSSGDFNKIYFKASNTFTITTDKWVAFHIQLPKSIRESYSEYALFCKLLAETIKSLMVDFEKILNAKINSEGSKVSNKDGELISGLFSGYAIALDNTELDIIFSQSTEELADEIIKFAEDEQLIRDDGSYLQREIEDLFWSNKGVRLNTTPSHSKYQTIMKKAWLIASSKLDGSKKGDKTISPLSNEDLAEQLLLFAQEANIGDNYQDVLNRETLELFWKSKKIRHIFDVSAETGLKIKQVEKIARDKLNAKVFLVPNSQLSQELADYAKKKAGRENGQGVYVHSVTYIFWRTKGLSYRTDSIEIEEKKDEVERLAQEIIDKDFHEYRNQRIEAEKKELPNLIQSCAEWARKTGRSNVTIKDVKYFLLEKNISILEATERALYLTTNNELKIRKKV